MEAMFIQAQLSKPVEGGTAYMTSWIPQRIAVVGATVRLKDPETGQWTEGWRVDTASGPAYPEGLLMKRSRDWTRTRAASDI